MEAVLAATCPNQFLYSIANFSFFACALALALSPLGVVGQAAR